MQKIVLLLLTLSVIFGSCDKAVKPTLHYYISNDINDSAVQDIYVPDSGTYTMSVKVKFLDGFQGDKIKLVITGLPAGITVTPDTFSGLPTYTQDFVFRTNNIAQGTYPITLTAYTETVLPQAFNFNIRVIPDDCAALFWGNIVGSNACTSRSFLHPATGVASGSLNVLTINNFGGYGVNCNVTAVLNCNNDSVNIPYANYGNGVILSGKGIFNSNTMIIEYTATSTPAGGGESCLVTYTK